MKLRILKLSLINLTILPLKLSIPFKLIINKIAFQLPMCCLYNSLAIFISLIKGSLIIDSFILSLHVFGLYFTLLIMHKSILKCTNIFTFSINIITVTILSTVEEFSVVLGFTMLALVIILLFPISIWLIIPPLPLILIHMWMC